MHSVTRLPDSEMYQPGITIGATPLMGGSSDKLMSNHVYNVGVMLRMVGHAYDHTPSGAGAAGAMRDGYGYGEDSFLIRSLVVVVYSLAMISSRGHYTVDVVLAWWALAAAEAYWPNLFLDNESDDAVNVGAVLTQSRTIGSPKPNKSRSRSAMKRK